MDKIYNIQICFKGLRASEWSNLKMHCNSSDIKTFSTKSEDGIIQYIISFVLDMSDAIDVQQIVRDGVIYDLIKELSRLTFDGVITTLIINGHKHINTTVLEIKKKIGNIFSKHISDSDSLYGLVEKYIEKYNREFDESILLDKQSVFNEHFLNIDLNNNIIFLNPSIYVHLTLFYFGSPKLSHLYALLKELISHNDLEDAEEVYILFKTEMDLSAGKIKKFIALNPQWITFQILIAVLHELGHHQIKANPDDYTETSKMFSALICSIADDLNGQWDNELLEVIKHEILSLTDNKDFLEELIADCFAIEWLVEPFAQRNMDIELANILASLFGHSAYIEYSMRINSMLSNNTGISREERLKQTLLSSIHQRVRLLVRSHCISGIVEDISKNKEAISLYYNLINEPFCAYNEDFDTNFLSNIDKYHKSLRCDYNPNGDITIREKLEKGIANIDSQITKFISEQLKKHHDIREDNSTEED